MAFLADLDLRPLPPAYSSEIAFDPIGFTFGAGPNPLEVLVLQADRRPTASKLRAAWTKRSAGRASPILVVALHADGTQVSICGPVALPQTNKPPVYPPMAADKAERICRSALEKADRHAALAFLQDTLPEARDKILGVLNQGLLATHALEQAALQRRDQWGEAVGHSKPIRQQRKRPLLQKLGYNIERRTGNLWALSAADRTMAIAVFLNQGENVNSRSERFGNRSPIEAALARADNEALPYVIAATDDAIRLYPAQTGVGVGQRGRSETFVQLHPDLLSDDDIGYLWYLFSAEALRPNGTFDEALADSRQYATDLGTRLRNRIYEDVIPGLAESIAEARGMTAADREALDFTYQMALTVLFRLLFIAYAEDKGLLPYRTNDEYEDYSLNLKAQQLLHRERQRTPFDDAPLMWNRVQDLFAAIDRGNHGLGIPPYNGGLFDSDPVTSPVGAAIKDIALSDKQFGPLLNKLLIDETRDGLPGPVDFRSLSVREFGTIYEGLLQSELSLAQTDLGLGKDGLYLPETRASRIVVRQGEIYLHNASGKRKATGSYYTKSFAVEHLLDHALEPALDDHLARLKALGDRASSDDFFDFRAADIAMGSGHFLVAAIDRIEKRFSTYLADNPIEDVTNELARLRGHALEILANYGESQSFDDTQLLRRQIARRCIYGVDLNPLAVELARLSIWVHTFVPGLPLSLLDYNLVCGNSLVGIATIQEATDIFAQDNPLFASAAETLLGDAKAHLEKLAQLSDADAAQITAARQAYEAMRESLGWTEALFDILAGSRLNAELKALINEGAATHWIRAEERGSLPDSAPHKVAQETLQATPPFHFPIAFPQVFLRERAGFDVILGNPPWEKAKLEEHRYWGRYLPTLHAKSARLRNTLIAEQRSLRPDLVRQYEQELASTDLVRNVLVTGPFPGMGTGDPDLYKGFVWRFWSLICTGKGRMGVVVPRSVFATKGASAFRKGIFCAGTLLDVTMLLNTGGWVFDDAEHRYTIALTAIQKLEPHTKTALPMRGPYSNRLKFEIGIQSEPVRFRLDEVFSWTNSAALPLLPDTFAAEVFLQLRKAPNLRQGESKGWNPRQYIELHATQDKSFMEMTTEPEESWWPVYKGASFDIWLPDTRVYYAWVQPTEVLGRLLKKRSRGISNKRSAFYGLSSEWARDKDTYPAFTPRIAFRQITNRTNTRTIIAVLIPPHVVAQHGAQLFIVRDGDELDEAYLLGMLSSIPLDWYARRFVELNMDPHIVNALPIPRPTRDNPLWQRVVTLAGRLAAVDERYADWAAAVGVDYGPLDPATKDDMIFELDAVVAHLYGLDAEQLAHIFATFHVGWDYHERLRGVLGHFHKWETEL
ncbi:MAG: hypothetical protein OXG23_00585 [Chloroflexi bacterium]|nr:hypothetical protein [Chloroflexota bacterium]